MKKQGSSRKTSTSALLTTLKPLTEWIIINCGKFLKRWEYQKQELETNLEQQNSSILGKEYIKAVCFHADYLTFMQSTSCKMMGWMKLESRLPGEISITSDMQMDTTLMAASEEELKSFLMKVKEESEKAGLKLNIKKLRSWYSVPLLHGKLKGKKVAAVAAFISWAPKSLRTVTAAIQ